MPQKYKNYKELKLWEKHYPKTYVLQLWIIVLLLMEKLTYFRHKCLIENYNISTHKN